MGSDHFKRYAAYYDIIYAEKPYREEADFVHRKLKKFSPKAKSLLELGCGSGRHAEHFLRLGWNECGIDLSNEMVALAKSRIGRLSRERAYFLEGDVRTFRSKERFDAVISLFHVASYQVRNDDFRKFLETAAAHLNAGGIFFFDFWYLPAVLHLRPSVRVKEFKNRKYDVVRLAEPEVLADQNRVNVNYTIFFKSRSEGRYERFHELHPMRYFSIPEMEWALRSCGFEPLEFREWMSDNEPSENSWGVYVVAKKRSN